ncbi:MAG: 1,4-dihydroxy-2-naphthoate polyprenyltransferase [Bacteroidetes bacterium]|nr:1,4-dihydroxy-2-naphthoate polyprenyltransferase [Bacteroidota bacterium]MCY4204135.1 1,4-dihydroxy-2-naphthoate polyprenyltransferase [Bacteroidota bacterium]
MNENRLNAWVLASRPKTLPVAIAPIIMASAMSWEDRGFNLGAAIVALVCALLITIGTNFCNDYADFARGSDTADRKGPTRVTQAGLLPSRQVRIATYIVFALAIVIGMYLIYRGGWIVLLIGLASISAGISYTSGPWPFGYKGLGDLFVLIFFGPVAVGGTYYVQTLAITSNVIIAGLAPGLLATAILVVNNIRDVDEDRAANKKTLIVRYGKTFGICFWTVCVVIAALLPFALIYIAGNHLWAGLTALILIPGVRILHGLITIQDSRLLNPLLPQTALLLLGYSIIFSLGWIL